MHALCTCYIGITQRKVLIWLHFQDAKHQNWMLLLFYFGVALSQHAICKKWRGFRRYTIKIEGKVVLIFVNFLGLFFKITFIGHKVSKGNVRVHCIF